MARGIPGRATYEAAPNIALVKYWGVRDPDLALPYNSSLSVTLDRLRTRTTVVFDRALSEDRFVLDGTIQSGGPLAAVSAFLDRVRAMAHLDTRGLVRSSNNFPTASGMASSASGFAALAGASTAAAGIDLTDRALSQLARYGSGSASRSIFGGFVEWRAGTRADGRDCYAQTLHPPRYWPSFRDLVVLIEGAPTKSVRSADAMQTSVRTSPYFARRQRELPARMRRMIRAIHDRDAATLFPLVMEECDSFRNVCETTVPSLDYLTVASRVILAEVRSLNQEEGRPVAAYTHDAGAHLHIFLLDRDASRVRRRLARIPGIRRMLLLRPGPGGRPLA
ncbi:MAG: diphosphomevalonate decarboxylase [Thermoplasmata archaeon]